MKSSDVKYKIIGNPTSFYIYSIKLQESSGWINGKLNEYHRLNNALNHCQVSFDILCEEYFHETY